MGTWGTGLYSNDLACDIRNDYREMIALKYTHDAAVQRVLREHELSENDAGDAAGWFALTDYAWRYGYLDNKLKSLAQNLFDSEIEKELWADNPKEWAKRKTQISKLIQKIQTPPEKPSKPSISMPYQADWHEGDLLAFQLQDGSYCGNYIVILIVSRHDLQMSRFLPPTETYGCYDYVLTTCNQDHMPDLSYFQSSIGIFYDTIIRKKNNEWTYEIYRFVPKMKKRDGDGDHEARLYLDGFQLNRKIIKSFTVLGRIEIPLLNKIKEDITSADIGSISPSRWGEIIVSPLCNQNNVLIYKRDQYE